MVALEESINAESTCLCDLGRPEDALHLLNEVVEIFRNLQDYHRRLMGGSIILGLATDYGTELARSLKNQSAILDRLGRGEDAHAAVEEANTLSQRWLRP
jgi:hypothetical protein